MAGILLMTVMWGGWHSCDRSQARIPDLASEEILLQEDTTKVREMPLIITYHLDSLTTSEAIEEFEKRFSEEAQQIIFALNRIDPDRLRTGATLIIPDTITSNFRDYSPFPQNLEMLENIPKTVLISRRVQAFGLYEGGKLVRWGPVSTGKKSTPTPAGLFYGNYKALRKISTVNDSWIMPYYFNIMNYHGVGVHQYTMPGYPASHACVRLYKDDAIAIYNWADQWKLDAGGREVIKNGTPFMVFGDYDFESSAPWLHLAENHNSNFLTAGEMKTLRQYVDGYCKDHRNFVPGNLQEPSLIMPLREGLETIK